MALTLRIIALLIALVATATAVAGPAAAARQINPPAWFVCNRYPGKLSISPPRVWAHAGRPEYVLWMVNLERWNANTERWYRYTTNPYQFRTMFDYFGRVASGIGWMPSGMFANSTMNIGVRHRGYYRVASAVGATHGGRAVGYVGGPNNNCFVR